MNEPLLSARLHCRLKGRSILQDIDFSLSPGEIVGVVGPNGAGKSTLLRCLNGVQPVQGSVLLDGKALTQWGPLTVARHIALMHQNTNVASPFTAAEVVMMGRYPHQKRFRAESAEDRRVVSEAMAFTDTSALGDRAIDGLSGGERQRVLFAKILAQDTRVLLLDEPSASLDLSYQEQIFRYARELASRGKAVVAAIHDLPLAARYCTRIVLLARGRVVADGPPQTVLTPAHLDAAYGVRVRVFPNPVTGELDFQLHEPEEPGHRLHIHLIAGGGSGAAALRLLAKGRYRVTAGVLSPGDTDLEVASAFGLAVVTSPPFSAITDTAFDENLRLVSEADLTIVSNLAVGRLNLRNLEAAAGARRLVLLEDEDFSQRDFTGGSGAAVYRALATRATVLRSEHLESWLAESRD